MSKAIKLSFVDMYKAQSIFEAGRYWAVSGDIVPNGNGYESRVIAEAEFEMPNDMSVKTLANGHRILAYKGKPMALHTDEFGKPFMIIDKELYEPDGCILWAKGE